MTYSSEKFCLKWNDFEQNLVSSYHDLSKDSEFSDVTLVCEGEEQIEAHKIIRTSCSPFFGDILHRNKHSHPLIYIRGVTAKNLIAIVDFIYNGEANIYQEDLDVFLALAEELQLKGLAGSKEDIDKEPKEMLQQPEHLKEVHTKLEPSYQSTYTEEQEGYANTIVDYQTLEPVDSGKVVIVKIKYKILLESLICHYSLLFYDLHLFNKTFS